MMDVSKGLIACDCENTIFGWRFKNQWPEGKEKEMNGILFGYLIDLKKSGYDIAMMSDSATANELRVGMANLVNTGTDDFLDYDGETVITKEELAVSGVPVLAAFDDAHGTHNVKTKYKFDPANEGVLAYMKEQREVFAATGCIEFDPEKLMQIQLATEAALRSEIQANYDKAADGAKKSGGDMSAAPQSGTVAEAPAHNRAFA